MGQNNQIAKESLAHYVGTWEHYDMIAMGQSEIRIIILSPVFMLK